MRAKIRMPWMVRAELRGKPDMVHIVASQDRVFDVPEYSLHEAPIVMERLALPKLDCLRNDFPEAEHPAFPPLRMIDGKLYRLFAEVPRQAAAGGVVDLDADIHWREASPSGSRIGLGGPRQTTFDHAWRSPIRDFVHVERRDNADGKLYGTASNLVSSPVTSIYRNRALAMGMDVKSKFARSMPHLDNWTGGYEAQANELDAALSHATSIDQNDVDEAEAMHARQIGRLVKIEGDLWYETRPPAVAVETRFRDYHPSRSALMIRYGFLQDVVDQDISTIYFPLDQMDAACEEARRLERAYRMSWTITPTSTPDFVAGDAFDFDVGTEHLRRCSNALSMTLCRTALQHPERIPDGLEEAMDAVREAFISENSLLGRFPGNAALMDDIKRIWSETRITAKWGLTLVHLQAREIRNAIEQIDNIVAAHSAVKVQPFMATGSAPRL